MVLNFSETSRQNIQLLSVAGGCEGIPISPHADNTTTTKEKEENVENCSGALSVAAPGCLSRIPDTDFYPSQIPIPKTATKERVKQNLLSYVFL
jgi:hypothetical protein